VTGSKLKSGGKKSPEEKQQQQKTIHTLSPIINTTSSSRISGLFSLNVPATAWVFEVMVLA
jgi:hypothetical protein